MCGTAQARYPARWVADAHCIHYYEAARAARGASLAELLENGWRIGWGNRSNTASRGGMQFLYDTWLRALERHRLGRFVGRRWVSRYPLDPADASRAQQLFVAWLLFVDDGRSWHEWSTARGCGLR